MGRLTVLMAVNKDREKKHRMSKPIERTNPKRELTLIIIQVDQITALHCRSLITCGGL